MNGVVRIMIPPSSSGVGTRPRGVLTAVGSEPQFPAESSVEVGDPGAQRAELECTPDVLVDGSHDGRAVPSGLGVRPGSNGLDVARAQRAAIGLQLTQRDRRVREHSPGLFEEEVGAACSVLPVVVGKALTIELECRAEELPDRRRSQRR